MQLSEKQQQYWRKNLKITAVLLAIWFAVTFIAAFYARELNQVTVFGFPLGFYVGAQGALIVYVVMIFYYARYMNRLDREFDVEEDD